MSLLNAILLSLAARGPVPEGHTAFILHVARLTSMLLGGALLGVALVLLIGLRGRRRIGVALLLLAALLISLGVVPVPRTQPPPIHSAAISPAALNLPSPDPTRPLPPSKDASTPASHRA